MAEGDGEGQTSGARSAAPDVFLSYASQDAAVANALCGTLEQAGIPCWLAPRDVRPGDFYADAIVQAITRCRVLLLVLSQAAIDSPHVLREVERASSKRRPIITFRIDTAPLPPGLEYFLSASQWLDASGAPADRQFSKLVEAVRSRDAGAANTEFSPSNIGGISSKQNRKAPLMVVTIVIATALAYFVADKVWISKRHASEHSKPTPTNIAAPLPNPASLAPAFDPPPHSIAVLPFVNMSGDAKQEYFSDGVTEELLNSLSHLSELQVVARTSSFSFKGQNVDIFTIAHKLNVSTILEGSVRRAGNTVRITVQLINATSGYHMWSQTYDRNLSDILKVQKDVANSVAQQLKITLAASDVAKVDLGGTHNADAYDAFLRGKQIMSGPNTHAETLRDALGAFDKAIALDPNFARAHAERAWALHGIAVNVHNPDDRAALREQARTAAERAVALAPDLGETHAALASIRAYALFDYVGAAPEFERALALSPGNATVQSAFAWYAADLGHFDQAISAARRAVSLDPRNAGPHAVLGVVLSYARRYPEALAAYEDFKALRPESNAIGGNIAQTLLASGQVEQARQVCESPSTRIDEDDRHQCLALAYHFLGRQMDAERELNRYQALDGDSSAYSYAGIYSQWGDVAAALQWLTKAEKLRDPLLWLLKIDWQLDPLRNEAQFKAIVARMNFPP